MLTTLPNWCSRTKWYANAIAFLFRVLAGFAAFRNTLLLSTYIVVGLVTFSPIDRKWYLMVIAVSTAFFNAVNSAPKVLVWTHVCLVDFQ